MRPHTQKTITDETHFIENLIVYTVTLCWKYIFVFWKNWSEVGKNCLCHPYSRNEAGTPGLGSQIFKQIAISYVNIQSKNTIEGVKTRLYWVPQERAYCLRKKACSRGTGILLTPSMVYSIVLSYWYKHLMSLRKKFI